MSEKAISDAHSGDPYGGRWGRRAFLTALIASGVAAGTSLPPGVAEATKQVTSVWTEVSPKTVKVWTWRLVVIYDVPTRLSWEPADTASDVAEAT